MMKFHFIFIILVSLNLNLTPNSRRRPVLPIPSLQQRPKNVETEKKLRALKTGFSINGISYDTNVSDLEYLSELGNGTSGHVVKMRHKPSGAIIAVKVSYLLSYVRPSVSYKIFFSYLANATDRQRRRNQKNHNGLRCCFKIT